MFNIELTERTYCVEVGTEVLLDILERDKKFRKPSVCEMLERLDGISNVQYDGHFGPYVFLTIGDHEDHEETWKKIRTIIGA